MRLLVLLVICLPLAACGPFVHRIDVQQGNYVEQEAVAKLKRGMTKAEVKQLLGTPLLADVFHANRWDYYFSHSKRSKSESRFRLSLFFEDEKLVSVAGDVLAATPQPASTATTPVPGK